MIHRLLSGIALLASGLVAGALLFSAYGQLESQTVLPTSVQHATSPVPSHSLQATDVTQQMEVLEQELNHYREWAYQLENQVSEFESRLLVLEEAIADPETSGIVATNREITVKDPDDSPQPRSDVLSVSALIDNGLDPQLAAELAERKNRIDMQRLELRDQAIRDGTFGKEQYFKALRELNGEEPNLRAEIGDNAYDRYLYTLGQPNRVIVTSVIPDSPAEQTGVQDGDIILAYNDQRIFNWSELRNATSEGELGEYIVLDIQRNKSRISLSIPRGPLGIRMGNKSQDPNAD